MLKLFALESLDNRGDTLIEVTIALSILAFVLLSSTAVVTLAFRTGQTARERIAVAEAAQQQMEALRSFRDNSADWPTFRAGVDPVDSGFYMKLQTIGSNTQWLPVAIPTSAGAPATNLVPTSVLKISSSTPLGERNCGYDFVLNYSFQTLGGDLARPAFNEIKTRLTNIHYVPPGGSPSCP